MKLIRLSKRGENQYDAMVDDEDFDFLNQWDWCSGRKEKLFYASRTYKGKTIRMHKLLIKGKIIDHIDGNGLNNQKHNLRICSHSDNCKNRRTSKKYRGAYKRGENLYYSEIRMNKKRVYLGCFRTEKEAALAYNKAAIASGNPFYRLNQIG